MQRNYAFLGLEKDTYKVVRQNVIDMILATEMTKHFEHLAKFVSVCNRPAAAAVDETPVDGLVRAETRRVDRPGSGDCRYCLVVIC